MLVLSRKLNESLVIDDDIHVQVLSVQGNRVRLGITAPRGISICRSELEIEMKKDGVQMPVGAVAR
jgi:carbon storage regulator